MLRRRSWTGIAPGITIQDQLALRNLSTQTFAIFMGMSEEHVQALLVGQLELSDQMAHDLERVLCTPAEFWCRLENSYRRGRNDYAISEVM